MWTTKIFLCSQDILIVLRSQKVATNMNESPWNNWMFYIILKTKSSCETFFSIYWTNTNFLFWVFWTCQATSIENDNTKLWRLWCLSECRKWTSFLTSFLWYYKDIVNLLLWVLWECLIIPISNNSSNV